MRFHRALLALAYLGFAAVLAQATWKGLDYYQTPLIERAHHEQYRELKPSGSVGLAYGVLGAGMMTVMLLYSARKRLRPLRRLGPVRFWLDYHILMGVFGPLFIVLHTSLKVGGIVSLSFWSMVVVALSGVFGRFLYLLIPRSQSGDELSLAEVEAQNEILGRRLARRLRIAPDELASIDRLATEAIPGSSVALALSLPFDAWRLRARLRRFLESKPSFDGELAERWRKLLWRKVWLRRRIALWRRLKALFHYWHVFHKPFALIMYLFMIVHIGVAWWAGFIALGA